MGIGKIKIQNTSTMKNSDKEKQTDNATRNKSEPYVQDKPDEKRVKTVTPANDNGKAGPAGKKS